MLVIVKGIKMKILLTGSTGFIGSYVLKYLIYEGQSVNVLVRDKSKIFNSNHPGLNIYEGNINDADAIIRATEGCDVIIHLAALVQTTSKHPEDFYTINYRGTENLLKAAKQCRVKRFIFTSSLSACTYVPMPVIGEDSLVRPKKCFSDYAESKAMAEQLVKDYSDKNLHYTIIYPASVFGIGPLTDANEATKALSLYLKNRLPFLIDCGEQFSSWAFVEDIARGIVSAVSGNYVNQRYILGGENKTLKDVYDIADRISGKKHLRINLKSKMAEKLVWLIETSAKLSGSHPLITQEWLKFLLQSQKLSSGKAVLELNYRITPIEVALEKTLTWLKKSSEIQIQSQRLKILKSTKITADSELAGY